MTARRRLCYLHFVCALMLRNWLDDIMLVSVTERQRVGIRKAVGATSFDICRNSHRSCVLTAIAALAGLIVGEVASL